MYRLNTKIRLTMLFFSGFELYSRWVPLCKKNLQTFQSFICHLIYNALSLKS